MPEFDHEITERTLLEGAFMDSRPVWIFLSAPHIVAAGGLGFPNAMLMSAQTAPLPLRFDWHLDFVRTGMNVRFHEDRMECLISYADQQVAEVVIPYAFIMQVAFPFPLTNWSLQDNEDEGDVFESKPPLRLVT